MESKYSSKEGSLEKKHKGIKEVAKRCIVDLDI